MPIYKPQYVIIGSNSTKSSQEIDKDLSISTSYPNPSGSGRHAFSIKLLVSGIFQNTTVISSSKTAGITRTTLVVTILKK